MEIHKYFGGWMKAIEEKQLYKVVNDINRLYASSEVMPAYNNIFEAFRDCDYDSCKVVCLGQDPYPQEGVATGIAFANKANTSVISPSLKVFIESIRTLYDFQLSDFDLTLESLSEQGVLMLNSALTCEKDKPGSHAAIWRAFMASFLCNLSIMNTGIVYILFGNQAQSYEKYISETGNLILKENHPAFFARTNTEMPNKVFKQANEWIIKQYGQPINWFSYGAD